MIYAEEGIVRLGRGEGVRHAALAKFGWMRMGAVPPSLADVCLELLMTTLEDGRVIVCDTDSRRAFWLIDMHPFFTLMAAAAGRLLRFHGTSCSSDRSWSLFGNIFGKIKNCLALERAKKLSYIHSNGDSGCTGADEEFPLSHAVIVIEDEQEAEEKERMSVMCTALCRE